MWLCLSVACVAPAPTDRCMSPFGRHRQRSDCGHVFVWSRRTGKIVRVLKGDNRIVNVVQANPVDGLTLLTSGIEYDIKLWAPVTQQWYREEDARARRQRVRGVPTVADSQSMGTHSSRGVDPPAPGAGAGLEPGPGAGVGSSDDESDDFVEGDAAAAVGEGVSEEEVHAVVRANEQRGSLGMSPMALLFRMILLQHRMAAAARGGPGDGATGERDAGDDDA